MLTPKNKKQNALYWGISFALTVFLAFLTSVGTNWPENGAINWRGVYLGVVAVIVSTIPSVIAGVGLPRFGRENMANLINEAGPNKAKEVLEQVVAGDNQQVINVQDINYGKLADEIMKKHEEEKRVRTYSPTPPPVMDRPGNVSI